MREEQQMTARLGRLVDSDGFQYGILVVIVLAALLVGLETARDLVARHGAFGHGPLIVNVGAA